MPYTRDQFAVLVDTATAGLMPVITRQLLGQPSPLEEPVTFLNDNRRFTNADNGKVFVVQRPLVPIAGSDEYADPPPVTVTLPEADKVDADFVIGLCFLTPAIIRRLGQDPLDMAPGGSGTIRVNGNVWDLEFFYSNVTTDMRNVLVQPRNAEPRAAQAFVAMK